MKVEIIKEGIAAGSFWPLEWKGEVTPEVAEALAAAGLIERAGEDKPKAKK